MDGGRRRRRRPRDGEVGVGVGLERKADEVTLLPFHFSDDFCPSETKRVNIFWSFNENVRFIFNQKSLFYLYLILFTIPLKMTFRYKRSFFGLFISFSNIFSCLEVI